jgi:serine/threonine-protein kinase RsbW
LEKEFELTVYSKLENLARISEFMIETMKHYNIHNSKDIFAVQLSVDEACTNIIKHAYSNKNEGVIVIRCMLSIPGNNFIVNIMDWGKAFDPTITPKPDTECSLNERKIGGLGIFFMRKFMDEVKYVRSKDMNLLIMAKYMQNEDSSKLK